MTPAPALWSEPPMIFALPIELVSTCRRIGAGSASTSPPSPTRLLNVFVKSWVYAVMGSKAAVSSTDADETRGAGIWIAAGGGEMGVTAMTLAPTSATPVVMYGRSAVCINQTPLRRCELGHKKTYSSV